jgi:hypothetical protein
MFLLLGGKPDKDYLKNAKIIAKMINESHREIRAYWFFTPYTTPDKELLGLLNPEKHEVALHVVNDPYAELELLEEATGRKVTYYTIHGTERLLGRIIWRRKRDKKKRQYLKISSLNPSTFFGQLVWIDWLLRMLIKRCWRKLKESSRMGRSCIHIQNGCFIEGDSITEGPFMRS